MTGARRPTASLLVQLLTLTGLTLLAAWAISAALLFALPPPTPDIYRLNEIEQAIRGSPPVFSDRRPLVVAVRDTPPKPELEARMAPAIRARLAEEIGVAVDRIVIAGERWPIADRRAGRIIRDRAARAGMGREEHFLLSPFKVGLRRDDGRWIVVQSQPGFGLDDWQQRVVLWFALSALAVSPAAWLIARRLSRPFQVFAEAAERLGRDPRAPPLDLRGPSEIAVAARAFNDMQRRLQRYVEDRTAMVGAIAHDLRTPLTRLRFRIEGLPEDQRARYAADLDQMEAMIAATLTFVRDATRPGERTPLELSSLVQSLCDEMAETGADAQAEAGDRVVVEGDPTALRRLVANLLENALKFGGRARARVFVEDGHAVTEVDDDGPGIPTEDIEKMFEPFFRREPSRNRETGGAGLGLAIVRSIARGHGGDVTLANRPGGGLRAQVRLPL